MAVKDSDVARAAARAGWRGTDLTVAIAVALAESGGNPAAHATVGEDSRGLWQINVSPAAHPELASQNLYDPDTNAAAAYGIWKRSGWGPWSAHNNGSYLLYMPRASAAALAADVQAIVNDPIGSAGSAISGAAGKLPGVDQAKVVAGFLSDLQNPAIWQRMLKVILGGALVVVGAYLIVQTQVAAPLAPVIKKVVAK